ncbi:hypothetical protein RJ640_028704 [Escallonia rubra]|uniref:Uncharacterized protein n=1 Tax=Escallonia rubra TaxID=112253 RepID=A0AA88QX70_9ASTE|nr:hypothetical protein RJ640_028704 [Escallonia rubra]
MEGPNQAPDELPIEFKNLISNMGGSEVKLVIEKQLVAVDVSSGDNRFLFPSSRIREEFLTEEEKVLLDNNGEGMDVVLIEPSLEVGIIRLRLWTMWKASGAACTSYVLTTQWNGVRKTNGLRQGMPVQLWSFRRHDGLGFALFLRQDVELPISDLTYFGVQANDYAIVDKRHTAASKSTSPCRTGQQASLALLPIPMCTSPPSKSTHAPSFSVSMGHVSGAGVGYGTAFGGGGGQGTGGGGSTTGGLIIGGRGGGTTTGGFGIYGGGFVTIGGSTTGGFGTGGGSTTGGLGTYGGFGTAGGSTTGGLGT